MFCMLFGGFSNSIYRRNSHWDEGRRHKKKREVEPEISFVLNAGSESYGVHVMQWVTSVKSNVA